MKNFMTLARLDAALEVAMADYKQACDDRRAGRATWDDVREEGGRATRLHNVYAIRHERAYTQSRFC